MSTKNDHPTEMEAGRAVLAEFGRRLARLRKAKGWTRSELAQRLGVSRERLAHWERGAHNPQLGALVALRRVLETPIDELITGEALSSAGIGGEQKRLALRYLTAMAKLLS